MEYYSDASYDSNEEEDEEEEVEIYTPRELDYMELEKLLESRGPPEFIAYCATIGVVTLRCAVVDTQKMKIENVLDPLTIHSWNNFWRNKPIDKKSLFSAEDFNSLGEFALQLAVACNFNNPTQAHLRNIMLKLLSFVNFKYPKN
tara:strand:- start:1390 stop:1824 length:435 start_codon:yes stop_codon:yes gene_type:complete